MRFCVDDGCAQVWGAQPRSNDADDTALAACAALYRTEDELKEVMQTAGLCEADYDMCGFTEEGDALRFSQGSLTMDAKVFYSIFIPPASPTSRSPSSESQRMIALGVYTVDKEATSALRKFKSQGARFCKTTSYTAARKFALDGSLAVRRRSLRHSGARCGVVDEVPLPFNAPDRSDLTAFRRAIERKNLHQLQQLTETNPLYIVNSKGGDCPVILHEGSRYNALHVAARSCFVPAASHILTCCEDPAFISRLYPDSTPQLNQERAARLASAYLNTPDKSSARTPLHWAAQKGDAEMCELLLGRADCRLDAVDGFGQNPLHLAVQSGNLDAARVLCRLRLNSSGSRSCRSQTDGNGKTPVQLARDTWNDEDEQLADALLAILSDTPNEEYYLCLYRDHENTRPPVLDRPATAMGPPEREDRYLAAVLGPCGSKAQAEEIYKEWSRPKTLADRAIRLEDPHKGMEKVGRSLADRHSVCWSEVWSLICGESLINLRTAEGLSALEQYLAENVPSHRNGLLHSSLSVQPAFANVSTSSPYSPVRRSLGRMGLVDVATTPGGRKPQRERRTLAAARKIFAPDEIFYDAVEDSTPLPNLSVDHVPASSSESEDPELGFRTPPSTPPPTDYITGSEPTKLDLDVLQCLKGLEFDRSQYPLTARLLEFLNFYQEDDKKKWPALDSPRHRSIKRMRKPQYDPVFSV